jgi:signal transduction histidine kinase/phage shock protein PspC (stress-responsive transcriptional regulator)
MAQTTRNSAPSATGHRRARHGRAHLTFARSRTDRIVAGVAAGLADRLGVDHVVVRLALVVLAFAGGVGVAAYLILWLASTEAPPGAEPAFAGTDRRSAMERALAVVMVVTGAMLVFRAVGLWLGDAVVAPVALGALGSAIIWSRADDRSRARWTRVASRLPRAAEGTEPGDSISRGRLVLGGLLILGGMAIFLAANDAFAVNALRNVAFAVGVTVAGVGLILGPGIWRLGRQLAEERRERIRQEERAEVAAHLHDSVLQSLAMIQRAATPQEMATLARRQERELRAWLYGRTGAAAHDSLARAMEDAAARVEALHHVRVEVVQVGDASLDERLLAMVQAAGEAMTNAARHAGVGRVSVYVEVEPGGVTAYVRDQGKGFDPESIPADRRGIAESIRGRMERAGGSAEVVTAVGEGTEVKLWLPRP